MQCPKEKKRIKRVIRIRKSKKKKKKDEQGNGQTRKEQKDIHRSTEHYSETRKTKH